MAKKVFTVKEQKHLSENPYTHRVSAKQISFTKEFKEDFWKIYCEKGYSPAAILEMLGYDPDLLGHRRVSGIQKHVREEMESHAGPHTGRRDRIHSGLNAANGYVVPGSLDEMQHEIQYLRQEVEYLKKISSIKATKK